MEKTLWNFNMQEAPGDGTEVVGINKDGEVRKMRYVTYDPLSPGYAEGRREWWWQFVSDSNFCHTFHPIAWMHLPDQFRHTQTHTT